MKKYILPIITSVSIILNIILICIISFHGFGLTSDNKESENSVFQNTTERDEAAKKCMQKFICEDLYYPDSYDPVSIHVDSAFYGPLTDSECVKAAMELIDLRSKLSSAESQLKRANHDIKNFGGSGVFWRDGEAKKEAEAQIKELKPKIEKRTNLIKNRDTSHDGEFIGWIITHRYRAANGYGAVSFSDKIYVVDPKMESWYFRYSADDDDNNNILEIDKVIRQELGIYEEN